nr:recombinase family protein [Butyrivibrio sp.]
MLSNEKYKGDALLQKRYTSDYLTKKLKVNNGEVPQYYIEDDHEAIISPEVFDMVQVEMKNRALLPTRYSGRKVFGSKIKCGDCGSFYGSKCSTPSYSEEELKEFSLKAMNLLITEKEEIIYNIESCMADICDIKKLKAKQEEITRELAIQVDAIQALLDNFINELQNLDGPIAEFDEVLFGVMVSELEAKNDNTIIFRFIDGTEIPIKVK